MGKTNAIKEKQRNTVIHLLTYISLRLSPLLPHNICLSSLSLSLSVCLSLFLSLSLSPCKIYFYQSFHPCLFVCLSTSVSPSFCLSVSLTLFLSHSLFLRLFLPLWSLPCHSLLALCVLALKYYYVHELAENNGSILKAETPKAN